MDRLHFQISNGLNFYFPISHNNISKHSIIKWKIKILMIFADPILFGIKSGDLNATRGLQESTFRSNIKNTTGI
jgi:hypothetical protein